jgi:hypothetical protein
MFSKEHRQEVLARLIEQAHRDPRITGAALTGSAAREAEDRSVQGPLPGETAPGPRDPSSMSLDL